MLTLVMRFVPAAATFAVVLAVAGCGGPGSATPVPTPSPTPSAPPSSGQGTMSAVIAGEAWVATPIVVGGTIATRPDLPGGILSIGGTVAGLNPSGRYRTVDITLTPAAVGSYIVRFVPVNPAGYAYSVSVTSLAGEIWWGGFDGPDGQVTVTSLTATRAIGTFQFGAKSSGGDTLRVTNGRFDVPVTQITLP